MCEKFGTLPYTGGLLEQDYWDVARMNIVINLQAERQEQEQKREAAKSKKGK